jgi:hypothetical protein
MPEKPEIRLCEGTLRCSRGIGEVDDCDHDCPNCSDAECACGLNWIPERSAHTDEWVAVCPLAETIKEAEKTDDPGVDVVRALGRGMLKGASLYRKPLEEISQLVGTCSCIKPTVAAVRKVVKERDALAHCFAELSAYLDEGRPASAITERLREVLADINGVIDLPGAVAALADDPPEVPRSSPEISIALSRADLEVMESGSSVFYSHAGVSAFIRLYSPAKQLVHEGLSRAHARKARHGRKPKKEG